MKSEGQTLISNKKLEETANGRGRIGGKSLAIYSAANDAYVPKAVLALKSFQKTYPELDYFLLVTADDLSSESKQLVVRSNIRLVDLKKNLQLHKKGTKKDKYPIEVFYKLAGPERLADLGYDYSLYVDGDVYSHTRFDFSSVLPQIQDFAARPVGTLRRTTRIRQRVQNSEYDFTLNRLCRDLELTPELFDTNFEYNCGVVIWNNHAMKAKGLLGQCREVFYRCKGCFEGDQDLLAFVSPTLGFNVVHLGDALNFTFFKHSISGDSISGDSALRRHLLLGRYSRIHNVHFCFVKPWIQHKPLGPLQCFFINTWRQHALAELGQRANELFGDLSMLKPMSFTSRVIQKVRRTLKKRSVPR